MMSETFLKPNDVILFQGDSITHAHRLADEGNDLFQMGAGYAGMCAARLKADRPQDNLTAINRGECGHTSRDLLDRWSADCLDLQPSVLSLLIGINDSNAHVKGTRPAHAPDDFRRDVTELITSTLDALPETRLILLEPFALAIGSVDDAQVDDVRARAAITRDLSDRFDAHLIPLQEHFDRLAARDGAAYWVYDGIHPTAAGHRLIADHWLNAIRA